MSLQDNKINEILEGVHPDLREDAREVLRNNYSSSEELVGIESEYSVVNSDFEPVDAWMRDNAIEDLDFAEREVGASMIELVTDSIAIDGLDQLYEELKAKENRLAEAADEEDLYLIRHGVHPTVEIGDVPLSDGERYQELIDYFDERREEVEEFGKEPVRPEGADIVGAICSTHLNVTAEGFDDAVEKANYLSMIQPWAVAMSGNSRIVEGQDTGYNSPRMDPMWEVNFNSVENPQRETQSGMTDDYLDDIGDYLQRLNAIFPKNSEEREGANLVKNAISERWKDERIKFYTGEEDNGCRGIVVEARLGDNQPTAEEEIAYHGFLRGRLAYAQESNEPLLPMERLQENRKAATKEGLDSEMWYWNENDEEYSLISGTPREMNYAEIEKAREGLERLDIDESGYLDIMEDRLENGTPSENQAEEYPEKRGRMPEEQALQEVMPVVNSEYSSEDRP